MDSSLFPVMLPLFPSLILILLAGPAILTPSTSKELQVRGERTPRDADQDAIKVVISEGCSSQGDSSDVSQGGKEIDLVPGSPLVLTHKIKLVPSGSGSGSCGCDADFTSLRERLESLEREVSDLRGKCGETGGNCCTSESKGAGCSIKPEKEECPNECSDQGRCVDGKCVCFPGYSGPDCSESGCPRSCKDHGRCVNGECVCDPGFSGPDCSQKACPDNCSNRGKCVNGKCVCNAGSTGPSCSEESCPKNCNRRGRCVNGQCVCNTGFTGPDCSKRGCPGNCNNRGRCVNGKCVCDSGSTGRDCSEVTCPGNCNNRGRCVNGKCICDSGSTGPDCSEVTCPGNCNNRGRCVNGKCICDSGSTGPDCSEVTCPGNCNNRGRCVDGKCVCDSGSTGHDCSEVSCPGNCNNRGRCVNGKCVCHDGFTGKDCQERACPNDCNDRGRCVDGKCVCDNGFTGTDCTEIACPGNCNNRGRCVNGQCVCDNGFTGADCSEKTCPDNCSNRGTCVDGRCVCESGFSGDDCSEYACPENCKNRGRCIDGQCVCNEGFTGEDCSEKGCPNNCNNLGRCVNGKCICDVPFTGPDCSIRGCPNDCSNKGRCIKGQCVCRRGFTGPDCSQCKEGMTGPNCNIAMVGVSQLGVQDITDSSATLIWTQPAVQYETYHITFTSQKEKDQQITVQVDGSQTTFTQTGLAAGQEYIVTIVGEINGRRGVESTAEFMTLISGPTNLQVVKTTSTSAVVQWEESQADIDRYRLTITPKDGAGRSQEMTIEAGQNSAHIQQLEAGRLYDILLVAEKGVVRSQPATTQVVPGTTEDLTMQVTQAPGQDLGSKSRDSKPVVSKVVARNDTRPKTRRPMVTKAGMFRPNATRVLPGGRRFFPDSKHKNPVVLKKSESKEIDETKADVQIIRESVADHSEEILSSERSGNQSPAVIPGNDFESSSPPSEPNSESSSEELLYTGSKRQPDADMAKAENNTNSVSSEPAGNIRSQEKKCMNKIKVTHFRLPLKNRGNGCGEDGIGLRENALSSSKEEMPPNQEKGLDLPQDSLHKLITETFDELNITTISVHLARPLNLSADAEMVRKQILKGFPSLLTTSSLTAKSSYLSPTKTSSPDAKPISSPTDLTSSSHLSVLSPSSKEPSVSLPSPSAPSTNLDDLGLNGSNELDSTSDSASTEDSELSSSEESESSPFHHGDPKLGSIRRLYPNFDLLRNKSHQNVKAPTHSPPHFSHSLIKETNNVSSSPSLSASRKTPSLERNRPVKDGNGKRDGISRNVTSEVGESQKKMLAERRHFPVRRLPVKGTYPRRMVSNLQNRTRPMSKILTRPSQSINPDTDTLKQQMLPTELLKNSTSHSGESVPSDPVPETEGKEGVGIRFPKTSISNEFNHTPRERVAPSSLQPNLRHPHQHGESVQNKTFMNFRRRQNPIRGPIRRPFLGKKQNGGPLTFGVKTKELGKDRTSENPESQSENLNTQRFTHGLQTNQPHEQVNGILRQNVLMHEQKTSEDKQTKESDNGDDILIKLEAPIDSDVEERHDTDRDIGVTNQSSISVKPVTLPKRQPTSRTVVDQHHGSQSIDGIQKKEFPKTNPSVNTIFDTETEGTKGLASEVSSSGGEREPLNFVDVTNQTSDGFTVIWDSPEGKYKNFVISRTEVDKDESQKQEENKQEEDKDQDIKEFSPENGGDKDNNKVPKDIQVPITHKGAVGRPTERDKTFRQVLPGSARSHQFEHLPPQTEYTITLLGKGPGILSSLHKLVISTGPEPPSNIMFSKVTENSMTVSWTKPKSSVDGFKVTYTHADEGEPVSVGVGSRDSTLDLAQLSPGSSYEVTVISTLGLDESDPIKDTVMTLPDPPTDLQAVNVTDSSALLLWRPALATVDKYTIVYGSGTGSEVRVTISGNAAEQQLSGLEGSTTYTVTVRSQLGNLESSPATTSFTTKSGSGRDQNEPQDLKVNSVTPRSAVVSWIPLSKPVDKYILVYRIKGESPQEIIVGSDLTQYKLTRLHPGSLYTVELRPIRGGQLVAGSNTEFTTGTLKFPFPADCSQELLNGVVTSDVVEIFPQGKLGKSMNVSCDMETDGGGWTVFQRRKDGSVEFYNGWKDYVSGFGNLSGEFWLGLEKIHNLTKMTKMNLRVDLRDGSEQVFAKYSTFEVSNRNYKLSVGGYSGTAGDSLSYHNNCVFSTKDRDPAPWLTRCAISYQAGWWYKNCHEANLNGRYGIDYKHQGLIWKSWKGEYHSIQFTEMKMRPASFRPPASRTK
ncbi:tenascin-like isoform X1 [Poecilia latipinna]|uniref:tenascin-like isoform X1 n=2 Tax=Poecilia latipinna TaxID=48699 RepID=UPI00072DBD6F|nr:PREDICTED: tenascin-like isoform X1 [Poecilia latipinna]